MIRLLLILIILCFHNTRAAIPVNAATSIAFIDGDSDPGIMHTCYKDSVFVPLYIVLYLNEIIIYCKLS